jgi:hypothetical protein
MENKSNLTNEELNVIELSVQLENAYNKLEEQQPNDKEEFYRALHACRNLVMIRGMRRSCDDNEIFIPINKKEE